MILLGGRFIFLEHGLGIEPKDQQWRRRLNPSRRLVGDGCRLDPDVSVIDGSRPCSDIRFDRFEMERVPRTRGTTYLGVEVKSAGGLHGGGQCLEGDP